MTELLGSYPFPVDAVYTWVDGQDPEWQKKRKQFSALDSNALTTDDAKQPVRWLDYGTLRYSLRSLQQNMPWIRRVYIVTDGQKPTWLRENDRLKVVSHDSLFDQRVLIPTFNSHVIESQLHRIDGLSEHFIYINDDVLLPKPLQIGDFFFSNGVSKFFPSFAAFRDEIGDDYVATDAAGKNLQRILKPMAWAPLTLKMKHTAFALRKSTLVEMEERFESEFLKLWLKRFRNKEDFAPVSQLYQYYSFLTNKAVPFKTETAYVDVGRQMRLKKWVQLLTLNDYKFLCLNCSIAEPEILAWNMAVIAKLLKWKFPNQSNWEE
jgi:Stealth protein CR2, conserved region 2/Stealth protein CR1, conserved region 1/Stealth protein CR3, conserved region 3